MSALLSEAAGAMARNRGISPKYDRTILVDKSEKEQISKSKRSDFEYLRNKGNGMAFIISDVGMWWVG